MNFGENLKTLRKSKKMSQEVLADKLGVTRQSISKWEVGEAYPTMNNIVALCSLFNCQITDLINDNSIDIDKFDKETKEEIVKFKKDQQLKMKMVSKGIYILAKIGKYVVMVPAVILIVMSLVFPFIQNKLEVTDSTVKFMNKEYKYSINNNVLTIGNQNYSIQSSTDLSEFVKKHNSVFYRISIEFMLITFSLIMVVTVLFMHYLYKLYKNIYEFNTPFTVENESLINRIALLLFLQLFLNKGIGSIYSLIVKLDMNIDISVTDIIYVLIMVSVLYIFKYGRMLQVETNAKMCE